MPVFDKRLPSVSISESENIILPVAEITALCLNVPFAVSAYCLYYACAAQRLYLVGNLAFIALAAMAVCGHGMHVACVMIQQQLQPSDKVYPLVDFLHEQWSHHTFQFGFYGLMLLNIWTEIVNQTDVDMRNGARQQQEDKNKEQKTVNTSNSLPQLLLLAIVKWVWPVILGLYFSIFAAMIGTKAVTTLFYLTVLSVLFTKGMKTSLWHYWRRCNSDWLVQGCFLKFSLLGIVVQLILPFVV